MSLRNSLAPLLWAFITLLSTDCFSQQQTQDSIRLDYRKIYSLTLDGDARSALPFVDQDTLRLSLKDRAFRRAFDTRFGFAADQGRYPDNSSVIDGLLAIYKRYWRSALLNPDTNGDSALIDQVAQYLAAYYPPAAVLRNAPLQNDSIDRYITAYLRSLHLHTTGFGKTGRLFDLLVWKTQRDTVYAFSLSGDTTKAPVCLMTDFITLGWEEYATLGRYYPGGWATPVSLFCVEKGYDLHSEDFLVSYLAHESRHFGDYKLFPKLGPTDLEYRAKLTELSLARTTLLKIIDFFISNANFDSDNSHSVADYCAIRDLSKALFKVNYEKDMNQWKQLPVPAINKAATTILQQNTRTLKGMGKDVETYTKDHPYL